jgi:hypothetical protein
MEQRLTKYKFHKDLAAFMESRSGSETGRDRATPQCRIDLRRCSEEVKVADYMASVREFDFVLVSTVIVYGPLSDLLRTGFAWEFSELTSTLQVLLD